MASARHSGGLLERAAPHDPARSRTDTARRNRDRDHAALHARVSRAGGVARTTTLQRAYSDSGLETLFVTRLRWLGVRIVQQAWLFGHRVDLLIGKRLVVQIDGGHHVGPQRESDIAHDAELTLAGFYVLRFGYHQVMHDWPAVQDRIARAVAQGLHLASRTA